MFADEIWDAPRIEILHGAYEPTCLQGAFLAIAVVPGLKYPANPPAVGDPETIGHRTALYFVMLAISIAAISTSVVCALRWRRRWGDWNAAIAAAAGFVVVIAVTQLVLPDVNEVPDDFPAVVERLARRAAGILAAR